MRISTVREFRDHATAEEKKVLFSVLSAEVSRQVKQRGLTEDQVLEDLDSWRKGRREARSRR